MVGDSSPASDVTPGEIVDFFPYPEAVRFCNRFATEQPAAAGRKRNPDPL